MGCTCRPVVATMVIGIVGLVTLIIGLISVPVVDDLMASMISSKAPITDNSSMFYDVWQNSSSVPIFMTYYVFNVTNPEDVKKHGAKPIIQPVGPFNYHEVRIKTNPKWSSNEDHITYTYNRTFTRVETPCPKGKLYPGIECSLDDSMVLTTGNIPLSGIAQMIDSLNLPKGLERDAIYGYLNVEALRYNEDLFIKRPAREIIFGYDDPLLRDGLDKLIQQIANITKKHIDPIPYAVVIQENNTEAIRKLPSGMYTGKHNIKQAFELTAWAGNNGSLSMWAGTCCPNTTLGRTYTKQANMINGTEGIMFQPNLHNHTMLYVWSDDLRRSAMIEHTSKTTLKGIDLHRYRIVKSALANMTDYPPNCGFDGAGPSGVLNLTAVVGGPVFASKPNFLDADPVYRTLVDGLDEPSADRDDTILDIEPHTGSVMQVQQQLQVNVLIKKSDGVNAFKHVNEKGFYLPMVKANEHGMVTDDLVHQWKGQVGIALEAEEMTQKIGVIAGGSILAIAAIMATAIIARRRFDRDYHLLDHHDKRLSLTESTGSMYGALDDLNDVAEDDDPAALQPRHSMHSILRS